MIVVMANGSVKWFGTLECFLATPYSRISKLDSSRAVSVTIAQKNKGPSNSSEVMIEDALDNDSVVGQEEQRNQTEAEARKEGMVELIVYKSVVLQDCLFIAL
jgi:ATP-binding cassette subfamily C (CFTR/MRP) protein 10